MHAYDYEPPRGGDAMRAVWIVDDDRSIRWVLEKALAREGIAYKTFSSAYEVLQALAVSQPQVLVSDIRMPGESGISLLSKVKERYPTIPVIVMTAYSDLDSAVQAFQGGAFEYLPKPFDVDHAIALIRRATSETPMAAPAAVAAAEPAEILGQAPAMQEVFRAIGRLSQSNATVLITGESGTGKELVARALHRHSPRAPGPFVAINTAAMPKDLLESELFGHERGSFTGAQQQRRGRFEQAEGGTLFLDEIGDMPPELQSKLLRFLQDRRFTPLGSTRVVEADVRIVAATSRVDLQKGGHVQEAVLGRLGAQPILLPPLHDRIEDVGRLVAHFLGDLKDGRAFEPEAFHALCLHAWPLNVRELSKVIEEAEALSRGAATIGLEHLPDAVTATLQLDGYDDLETTDVDLKPPPDDGDVDGGVESDPGMTRAAAPPVRARRPAPTREELTTLLAETKGSVAEVARRLNRQYAVIWRCVQRYGIDASSFRGGSGGDQ